MFNLCFETGKVYQSSDGAYFLITTKLFKENRKLGILNNRRDVGQNSKIYGLGFRWQTDHYFDDKLDAYAVPVTYVDSFDEFGRNSYCELIKEIDVIIPNHIKEIFEND